MSEGRVLAGRYELGRVLGRGGMAEVYAAHDQALGREVAVKLLLDRFREDESFTRRFQDEARHVARLNHPNLVAVYDTGTDQGQPFIVMELVEGRSMQQAIAAGGLTEDRALEVTAEVCAALGYAHERGLVHRDIKPGNILLADDGSVKVTDFGIARAVDNETVTRTAAVLGTAAYLSPEQAQGLDVDARSDLYSLGVVLYEALTGEQPFQGDTPVTVAYQHVQEPPQPPRELDESISPAAEAITMRALAKNPANRYQDAAQMREDLLNAQVGNPVAAPAVLTADETALLSPTGATRPIRSEDDTTKRRRGVYVLLAILGLLAIGGIIWALTSMFEGEDVTQVSVPDLVDLSVEQAEAQLEQRGLVLGEVTPEANDDVDEGLVLRSNPGSGEQVDEGTAVDLVVSAGAEMTTVPDLDGLTEEEALAALREANLLQGGRSTENSSEVPEGQILSQDPSSGTEVAVGSSVSYVISAGEAVVRVPPVTNRSESDAISLLEQQGLQVQIGTREFSSSVEEGFVIDQDPSPGTEVAPDSIVTIIVSRGEEPPPEPTDDDDGEDPPTDDDGEDPPTDDDGGDDPPTDDGDGGEDPPTDDGEDGTASGESAAITQPVTGPGDP